MLVWKFVKNIWRKIKCFFLFIARLLNLCETERKMQRPEHLLVSAFRYRSWRTCSSKVFIEGPVILLNQPISSICHCESWSLLFTELLRWNCFCGAPIITAIPCGTRKDLRNLNWSGLEIIDRIQQEKDVTRRII